MTGKQRFLETEAARWHDLQARFDRLSAGDWERAVEGEWSPKDLLTHIASWHSLTVDRLEQLGVSGSVPPLGRSVDDINAEMHESCRTVDMHDARVMSEASRHRFLEEVAALDEPIADDVLRMIEENGHEHYDDHIPPLDAFLDQEGR